MAAEEIIFKVGVDTGNSVNDLSKVEKGLNDIDKSAQSIGSDAASRFEALNKKVESGTMTIRDAQKAIKEYQTIALQAGRESPIGQAAIQAAGELKDTIGDLRTELTNAGTDGANMQAALQLGGTIAAGYGAMQGTMALLGSESEQLQQSMQKLMAVQALLASIEEIRGNLEKESFLMMKARALQTQVLTGVETVYTAAVGGTTGAMKALRLAMLAVPIVAVIAGVVALVANFDKLKQMISGVSEAQQLQNKVATMAAESASEELNALDKLSKVINDENISRQEKSKAISALQEQYPELLSQVDAENSSLEQVNKALKLNAQLVMLKAQAEAVASLRAEEFKKQIQAQVELQTAQNAGIMDYAKAAISGSNAQLEANKRTAEGIKESKNQVKALDDLDKGIQKQIGSLKAMGASDEDLGKKEDELEKKREAAAAAAEKRREEEKKKREEEAQKRIEQARLLEDLIIANIEDADQRALAQLNLKHQREKEEIIKKYGEQTELIAELEKSQQSEMFKLMEEQDKAADEKQKEKDEKAKADAKAKLDKELADQKAGAELKVLQAEENFYAEQEAKKELALIEMQQALMNTDLTENQKLLIKQQYADKIKAIDDDVTKHEKENAQMLSDAKMKIAQDSLQLIQNITELFGKKNEKSAKVAFNIDKAAKVASATMAGIEGTINAYKTAQGSPITALMPAYPAIQAGLAAAFAATNIAKIASAKFQSTGGGGASAASVSAPSQATPAVTMPEASTTLTANLPGAGGQTGGGSKVYVLDSDITAQQTMSQKVESLATFGG